MKGKKFIESKKEGEYELIKNHVIDIDISEKEIHNIWDYLGVDDPEESYMSYGVALGFDDDIFCIELTKFINQVDTIDDLPDVFEDIINKLRDFKEYTLYPN